MESLQLPCIVLLSVCFGSGLGAFPGEDGTVLAQSLMRLRRVHAGQPSPYALPQPNYPPMPPQYNPQMQIPYYMPMPQQQPLAQVPPPYNPPLLMPLWQAPPPQQVAGAVAPQPRVAPQPPAPPYPTFSGYNPVPPPQTQEQWTPYQQQQPPYVYSPSQWRQPYEGQWPATSPVWPAQQSVARPAATPPLVLINDTLEATKERKTYWERHPRTADLFHLVPNHKTHCLQGTKDYMEVVLARLKMSPLSFQYANSTLDEGSCSETTNYNKGPDYHRCFPKASLYHWFAQNRKQIVLKEISESLFGKMRANVEAAQKQWKEYVAEHDQVSIERMEEELEAVCDNGRMMEETFGMAVAAATFSARPSGDEYCIQGSKNYLQTVLGHLNSTEDYANTQVEEGACALHNFKYGPAEARCLPHASIYLSSLDASSAEGKETKLGTAARHLEAACDGGAAAQNVSDILRSRQEKANTRAKRLKEDAEELAHSNYYMFDEKLYACWQGPQHRLENVKDYFRKYGMPEHFFEKRMKIYSGSCDNQCMLNGWVERRSCIRHVRQCRHPEIKEIDMFLNKLESLVKIIGGNRKKVDEMIEGSDLEKSCQTRGRSLESTASSLSRSASLLSNISATIRKAMSS